MSEPTRGSASLSSAKLPAKPSGEFLRKLAKERLRAQREREPGARLYEAQLQVAREHGFTSWRDLMDKLNGEQRGVVRRDGERVVIEGVAPLQWSGSDNTYLQAMAKSLAVIGPAHDYVRLFGDSGLAFRVRVWADDAMTTSCPSSPVGEFMPWTLMTENSIGWKVRVDLRMGPSVEDPAGMEDRLDEVKASIDTGTPVLAYPKMWDMGIIYGYEGSKVAVRDFHVGATETWMEIAETRGLFMFFEERGPVPSAEASARVALAEAVSRWSHRPDRQIRKGSDGPNGVEGAYYYGAEAYDRWVGLLRKADGFTPERKRPLLHASYWTYISLHDARQKAAPYLRSVAEFFPSAKAIRQAADLYQEAGEITGQVIHDGKIFPAFYMPDALERWTPEVRAQEIALLERLKELDRKAIGLLTAAA